MVECYTKGSTCCMYMWFLSNCLYSTVSWTCVREWYFTRLISYYYYYNTLPHAYTAHPTLAHLHTAPVYTLPCLHIAPFIHCPVYTLPCLKIHSLFNSFNHLCVPSWRNSTVHATYTLGLMGRKVFMELLYLLMPRLRTRCVQSKSAPISALPWRSRMLKQKTVTHSHWHHHMTNSLSLALNSQHYCSHTQPLTPSHDKLP